MMLRTCALLLAALGVALPAESQAFRVSPTRTIEVIGLRRWTIPMLEDSIQKYAPGTSLESSACAAVLRYKLGFADALVDHRRDQTDQERIFIAVVEPQDSARVRHRVLPSDSTSAYAPWATAVKLVAAHPNGVVASLSGYRNWRQDSTAAQVPAWVGADTTAVRDYWRWLATKTSPSDLVAARSLLIGSRDYRNRVAAASVLFNFLDQDATLHLLVIASLEPDGIVKDAASSIFESAVASEHRTVDWMPSVAALHAILDGTSLSQLSPVIRILVATHVDRRLAVPLLKNGGHMLLAYAGAEDRYIRADAHRLLVALKGDDLGPDAETWRRWVESL